MDSIEFPDISYYQGSVNWNVMSSKTKNIILRSSQGNWEDPRFKVNYSNAKAYGMRRGIYHFFDDRYSPNEQLNIISSLITKDMPEARIWIDWEDLSYHVDGRYKGIHPVVVLMKLLESRFPKAVIGFYTAYYWFTEKTDRTKDEEDMEYLSRHPLWLAAYTANGSSGKLLVPYPWKYPPELHQYGTPVIGEEYGVSSKEIDMDRVLSNFSVYATNPIPEPPTGEMKMIGKVLASALNIRKQPNSDNTTNPPIGKLQYNDVIEADFKQEGWWHLKKIMRAGLAVALPSTDCYAYEGATQGYIQDITPSTPPIEPIPPQEVIIKDSNGVSWKCTVFTRV